MNSSKIFELVPITSPNYDYVPPSHDVLDTIREVVENSLFGVSLKAVGSRLRKQHGIYISISTATSSSGKIFMYISGIDNPTRLYIRMINPLSLVNQSLRTIKMALRNTNDIQALKIPNRFKDSLINSQKY